MFVKAPPKPPYYAVIFTSQRGNDDPAYDETAERMLELAAGQPGYLGIDSVRSDSGLGITVSYWRDQESIHHWKQQAEHLQAQKRGRKSWYQVFTVQVARVERNYAFGNPTAESD